MIRKERSFRASLVQEDFLEVGGFNLVFKDKWASDQ
jgi:hypothetical protein